MNGYNFTERVRKILAIARDEAARLGQTYVGPEHMLLGIAREGDGLSAAVLRTLNVDLDALADAVEQLLDGPRADMIATGPDLPYSRLAKRTLELAMDEARALHHQYVGSEHLLLGLLRDESTLAARALSASGVTLQSARTETLRLLGNSPPRAGPVPTPAVETARPTTPSAVPSRITDQLREQVAWNRLTRALEVSQRLGTSPALTLEADGTLTVPLGPDFVVSVDFPPTVRLRRKDADANGPAAGGSAQEAD